MYLHFQQLQSARSFPQIFADFFADKRRREIEAKNVNFLHCRIDRESYNQIVQNPYFIHLKLKTYNLELGDEANQNHYRSHGLKSAIAWPDEIYAGAGY
jgi:hypothetical protein